MGLADQRVARIDLFQGIFKEGRVLIFYIIVGHVCEVPLHRFSFIMPGCA
jgi:hypothetical protein